MAEKIVSPGVFTRENDLSFVQSGVGAIGAAVIGPTVKGPALIPTEVFTYGEYQKLFGDSFKSGSDYYQYLTSMAAKDYLKHGGPLTVTRILPAGFSNADAFAHMSSVSGLGTASSGQAAFIAGDVVDGAYITYTASNASAYQFRAMDAPLPYPNAGASGTWYFLSASGGTPAVDLDATKTNFLAIWTTATTGTGDIAVSGSHPSTGVSAIDFTGSINSAIDDTPDQITVGLAASTNLVTTNGVNSTSSFNASKQGVPNKASTVTAFVHSFKIETHAHGLGMNSRPTNAHGTGSNNILTSNGVKYGTKDNLRWEVSNINNNKGTFTLSIRRGDDTDKRKVILESFSNCSLDPQASNYLGKKVGTAYKSYDSVNGIVKSTGTYPNMSQYVYIDEASIANTVDYLDDNGTITDPTYTGSLPQVSNGTFANGSDGSGVGLQHPQNFYQTITTNNQQGLDCGPSGTGKTSYFQAIDLLSNADEYDVNLVFAPGINHTQHPAISNKLISMCETRGDAMCIVDPVEFNSTVAAASAVAGLLDSSYAAMYWPWVQVADPSTGKYVYVPQATVMPGIYAFNDKVSAEWFAPAGLNRGGQESVIQAEVKLTHAHRDTMYENNLNPVATFPGEGVVVWGQKTLQKKASALDRVNVRRLLINLKKFIASTSKYLVFENNTDATRNRFLSTVNPYMESVQSRQGLYAFKVVMDATNNTPDIIDQNILKGDIFLQPAKAAEFIVIDFNVMPTGATFND
jgi:hypothetical protein